MIYLSFPYKMFAVLKRRVGFFNPFCRSSEALESELELLFWEWLVGILSVVILFYSHFIFWFAHKIRSNQMTEYDCKKADF